MAAITQAEFEKLMFVNTEQISRIMSAVERLIAVAEKQDREIKGIKRLLQPPGRDKTKVLLLSSANLDRQ